MTLTAHTPRPSLRNIVQRVAVTLLVACVIPAALFYSVLMAADVWIAMFAALAWSYGAIAFRAATGRRTSGMLILAAIILTGRTVVALVSNSTFLYFLQPIISDGVVAITFLLSLATARPMVARLAGDFYPMDHDVSLRPRVQRLFRHLTLMWAALCLGRAVTTLWLLNSLSVEDFVLLKELSSLTMNVAAVAVTIMAATVVARQEGLLAPAPIAQARSAA